MPMYKTIIFCIALCSAFAMGKNAMPKFNTIQDIVQIMEKSPTLYSVKIMTTHIPVPDRGGLLNTNDVFRTGPEGSFNVQYFNPKKIARQYSDSAEVAFERKDYSTARDFYLMALTVDPKYYKMMTFIGQTYEDEGKADKAIEWYKKALDSNYIDFMAHWFLAVQLQGKGDGAGAVNEITIAKILNRNNPRLNQEFLAIYRENGLKAADWTFNPQMQLDSTGPGEITIQADTTWLLYATAKALWRYEPGYRAARKVDGYSDREERECLTGLLVNAGDGQDSVPERAALAKAADSNLFAEYILYEIELPKNPQLALFLSKAQMEAVKQYVITVRGGEKSKK